MGCPLGNVGYGRRDGLARAIIIYGHLGSDTGYTIVESDGTVTTVPGNRYEVEDLKCTLQILRYATQIKNPELRKVVSQAAGEYIQGQNVSEILDQRGNVMAVF